MTIARRSDRDHGGVKGLLSIPDIKIFVEYELLPLLSDEDYTRLAETTKEHFDGEPLEVLTDLIRKEEQNTPAFRMTSMDRLSVICSGVWMHKRNSKDIYGSLASSVLKKGRVNLDADSVVAENPFSRNRGHLLRKELAEELNFSPHKVNIASNLSEGDAKKVERCKAEGYNEPNGAYNILLEQYQRLWATNTHQGQLDLVAKELHEYLVGHNKSSSEVLAKSVGAERNEITGDYELPELKGEHPSIHEEGLRAATCEFDSQVAGGLEKIGLEQFQEKLNAACKKLREKDKAVGSSRITVYDAVEQRGV